MMPSKGAWFAAAIAIAMLGCSSEPPTFGADGGGGEASTTSGGGTAGGGAEGGLGGEGGDGGTGGVGGTGGTGGVGGGGAGEPDWSCLGNLPAPTFAAGTSEAVFAAATFGNGNPVGGAAVEICALSDTLCTNPMDMGVTSGTGAVSLEASTTAPVQVVTTSDGIVPTITLVNGPVQRNANYPITTMTPAALTAHRTAIDPQIPAGFGTVLVLAVDCQGVPASGVTFTIDNAPSSIGYFDESGDIDLSLTATTARGRALLVGVANGTATVSAALEDDTPISDRGVLMRGNMLTDSAPHGPTPLHQP